MQQKWFRQPANLYQLTGGCLGCNTCCANEFCTHIAVVSLSVHCFSSHCWQFFSHSCVVKSRYLGGVLRKIPPSSPFLQVCRTLCICLPSFWLGVRNTEKMPPWNEIQELLNAVLLNIQLFHETYNWLLAGCFPCYLLEALRSQAISPPSSPRGLGWAFCWHCRCGPPTPCLPDPKTNNRQAFDTCQHWALSPCGYLAGQHRCVLVQGCHYKPPGIGVPVCWWLPVIPDLVLPQYPSIFQLCFTAFTATVFWCRSPHVTDTARLNVYVCLLQ